MLRIIPKPDKVKVSLSLPETYKEQLGDLIIILDGVYLEYIDDFSPISFQFFTALGRVYILNQSTITDFTTSEIETFFRININYQDLREWLKTVPFRITEKIKIAPEMRSQGFEGSWRLDKSVVIPRECPPLTDHLTECIIGETGIKVRCFPYDCIAPNIKEVSYVINLDVETNEEEIKSYWSTLCLLKYLNL